MRRQRHEGFNELPEAPPASPLKLFLSQFTSVIIWVLTGAAVVSGLLHDWLDAAAIMAIVFLNGVLGFIQEFRRRAVSGSAAQDVGDDGACRPRWGPPVDSGSRVGSRRSSSS